MKVLALAASFALFALVPLVGCGDDNGAPAGADAGSTIDGTTPADSGGNLADADLTLPDADPLAPDAADTTNGPDGAVGVTCGSMSCTGTDECCVTQAGASCVAVGTCQGGTVTCDGPEDCSGNACCGSIGGGGGGASAECGTGPACPQGSGIQLCHNNPDCPGGATAKCCVVPGFGGYCAIGGACPF